MIRPVTLVTMLMAALSGAYLFGVKHRAQVLDDQLAAVTQASRLDDQRIAVLQAQWSLEIDHNRLQALTQKFSGLAAMKPSQLVTLADLARALPPAGSAAPEANPAAPMPAAPMPAAPMPVMPEVAAATAAPEEVVDAAAEAAAPAAAAAVEALPLPPPEAPAASKVILASVDAVTPRKRVARVVAKVAARKSHFEGTELAENLPVARPEPIEAKIVASNALPAGGAAGDSSGQGGSMLGMAADLAPPQPLAGTSN